MNKQWIKAAGIRAIKTMAQSGIAVIGSSTMITQIDFKVCLSTIVLSGVLSILTSLAGLPEVENDGNKDI